MKRLILGLILLFSMSSFGIEQREVESYCSGLIDALSGNLSQTQMESISVAKSMIKITEVGDCDNHFTRRYVAKSLYPAISMTESHITLPIAEEMKNLCKDDEICAQNAISTLSRGLSQTETVPSLGLIDSIIEIVKQAPYISVKIAARNALSNCMGLTKLVGKRCSSAIEKLPTL